jgi:hypothetical protein
MKPALLAILPLLVLPLTAAEEKKDAFEIAFREAWELHKAGKEEEVAEKLRELLQMVEKREADQVVETLPSQLEYWKGGEVKREDLAVMGGGIAISRTYATGKRKVEVKVIKDSPLMQKLAPLIANPQLLALGGRKTHKIAGKTAVMEGDKKLQMILSDRIYLELNAIGEATEKDMLDVARRLDLRALAEID